MIRQGQGWGKPHSVWRELEMCGTAWNEKTIQNLSPELRVIPLLLAACATGNYVLQ
jgi:hypothetical protein